MVGFCGGIGSTGEKFVNISGESLQIFGDEHEYSISNQTISINLYTFQTFDQPIETDDQTKLFLWGHVYGYGSDYRSKDKTHPNISPLEFCKEIYEEDGFSSIENLNGEYTLLAFDPENKTIQIVTDRLGTHPVYWVKADDGEVIFSSSLQSLIRHPEFTPKLNQEYLYEYLALRRSYGLKTPVEGIKLVHPGSITTINCVENTVESDVYWRPNYRSNNISKKSARQSYVKRFRTAISDREATVPNGRSGVLMSGGNDSRAILAAMDDPPIGFHMTDDESATESRVAKQVIRAAGADLHVLNRHPNYEIEALEQNTPLCDFISWYNQAHAFGFANELRSESDLIYVGLYGDVYSGGTLPQRSIPTPLGQLQLPVLEAPNSIAEFLELYLDGTLDKHSNRLPDYCQSPPSLKSILESNIRRTGDYIEHHGVKYRDLNNILFAAIYPITNRHSFLFYSSLYQTMPATNPFFDYRLLDWLTEVPFGKQLRMDVQNHVIREKSPTLAEIPHAARSISPKWSFPIQYISHRSMGAKRRIKQKFSSSTTQDTGFTTDYDELLRTHPFVRENIEKHSDLIDSYQWLDQDGIESEYQSHSNGEKRRSELMCLLTFLNMPIHDHIEK